MTSLTLVLIVAGVAALGNVNALSDEVRNNIYAGMIPLVAECSKQYGVTQDELKEAKDSGSIGSINPCLMACVFKKAKVINDEGLFDSAKTEELTKKFLPNEDDQTKAFDVIKSCSSVNDKEVSDAAEGCERAKLLFDCFIPFKGEFLKSR